MTPPLNNQTQPKIDFDIAGFVNDVSVNGPKKAMLKLITDLSLFTWKAKTSARIKL